MDVGGDFFEEEREGPERDQWQRPVLHRADGTLNDAKPYATRYEGRWPYTRASSLSDNISDFAGLHVWQQRNLVRGLGYREDLATLAASVPMEHPTDTALNRRSNITLDEIIVQAFAASGAEGGRNYGTAFHALTEPGADPEHVPYDMKRDVDAFNACLRDYGLRIGATEQFVANDRWMSAGTFDHLVWVPGYGWVVADKKTAKKAKPLDYAIQMAIYAGGDLYDWRTDTRTPLVGPDGGPVNQDWGLLFWVPKERGICEPILIDLEMGRRGAQLCLDVREFRKMTAHQALKPLERSDDEVKTDLRLAISHATTKAEIEGLANTWKDHPAWSEGMRARAAAKWRSL